MGIINDITRAIGRVTQFVDRLFEGITNPEFDDQQTSEIVGQALENMTPADEVAATLTDTIEETILADLQQAGEVTPENVEDLVDGIEGGQVAFLAGVMGANWIAEFLTGGQVDGQNQLVADLAAAFAFDDATGMELDARLQEGVAPALQAKVAKEHRSQFVDLPDAVEFLVRAKTADDGWLRGRNVDPDAAQTIGSNEPVNPENLLEEWGIRDDNLEVLERVALQIPEIEELIETPLQLGEIPDNDVVDEVLQLSGSPESVKDLFRRTIANAPRSADIWEQRSTADELVPQLDELVLDGEIPVQDALQALPDELEAARPALRDRWTLLADLPGSAPTRSQVESAFQAGLIDLEQFLDLLARVQVDPAQHPFVPHETILSELDGDLRTAVGLGHIEQGQYAEYARLAGLDQDAVDRLLQGDDLDQIAESRLQQQADQGTFPVDVVAGIGESRRQTLEAAGIDSVAALAQQSPADLVEILDVAQATAEEFISRASQLAG